tara:strand:+ start:130 stop:5454 length:5325 start_codon:yes stop_codon:yes gene_type:complete
MAENDSNQPSSIRYVQGLFKDTSHIDQPAGTLRFAKNAIVNAAYGAISNEEGNALMASLPDYSTVIGAIPVLDNQIALFLRVDNPATQLDAFCEIGIYTDSVYETILRLAEENVDPAWDPIGKTLNFQESNPIEGTFVEQGDGDQVIYWTDDLNSPRTLNITRQQRSSINRIYGVNLLTSNNRAYVGILDLFPNAGTVPHVDEVDVNMGGECRSGVYYLALAYTDEDFTRTNFVTVANPVSIVPATEGIFPIESYDGAPADTPTGKSIKWKITNINTDYKFLTAAVVFDIGKGKQARKLPEFEILGNSEMEVVYSGERGSELFSVEEVTIDKAIYDTAKSITQLDGTLYLGNLEATKDLGYQKYANYIALESVVKEFDPFDPFQLSIENLQHKKSKVKWERDQGYRDALNIFKFKGYTREEVYAFYIAFVLRDGSMSYAYHIPGRAPLQNIIRKFVPELRSIEGDFGTGEWVSTSSNLQLINEDDRLYTPGNGYDNWHILSITGGSQNPISHFFQWYDFSTLSNSRQMNYWENLNEFYPDTEDFEVVDAQQPSTPLTPLRTENVRHHRFPSNLNPDRTTVKSTTGPGINSLSSNKVKLVVNYAWFRALNACNEDGENQQGQAGTGQGSHYSIASWSGSGMSGNSECQDFENFVDDIEVATADNMCQYWDGMNTNSCNPATNTMTDPRDGAFQEFVNGSPEDWHWCEEDPENIAEVEHVYAGTAPPQGSYVMLGWWRRNESSPIGSNAACGNTAFGWVRGSWTVGNSSFCWMDPKGNYEADLFSQNISEYKFPPKLATQRPGWIAWATCVPVLEDTAESAITNNVQALGFKLSDIKIPKSIADKVQGFRIYYANRTHENRTVLGQNPIHDMAMRRDMDTANCPGYQPIPNTVTDASDYLYPAGIPGPRFEETVETEFSFHDFYLLNGQKDITPATHLKTQYLLGTYQFRGNTTFYNDEVFPDPDITGEGASSCISPAVWTAFFASGTQTSPITGLGTSPRANYVLRDKAKAYVNGNVRFKGKPFGFGEEIYNVGGETILALATTQAPVPKTVAGGGIGATWNWGGFANASNDFPIAFSNVTSDNTDTKGLSLLLVNLKAFRTNLYNSFDVQDLVWTGYEVIGDDLDNFVVDEDGTPIPAPNTNLPARFTTEDIYGGDTFICRHGYRMTSREETLNRNYYPIGEDMKSVFMAIVESTDNINFRHIQDLKSTYFPGAPVADLLDIKANEDLTYAPDDGTGNMRYNEAYSSVNDVKAVYPKPLNIDETTSFPGRVIRSNKLERDSIIDTYRIFKVDQYRELPTHKGELWKLISAENLLYFHMEDTLFRTKGKQKMKLDDGTSAYVGSGDLFAQDPDELVMADTGYIGTRAQRASVITPNGYFSVDVKTRKVFLVVGTSPVDLTSTTYGMQRWFQANIPFALEAYGFNGLIDSPITGMGFHAVWDQRYSRVILTKRDILPTEAFIADYSGEFESTLAATSANASGIISVNSTYYTPVRGEVGEGTSWEELEITSDNSEYFTQSGWTISFTIAMSQGKAGSWTSFHDYIPYIYTTLGIDFYSFIKGYSTAINRGIYRHSNGAHLGKFYNQTPSSFEVEIIHNFQRGNNKLFYSLNWLADVFEPQTSGNRDIKDLNAGFTSFIVYNSDANSGESAIEYMINTRKTGGSWKVNQFRDMSLEVADSAIYYTGAPFTGGNYGITGVTVAGTVTTSVPTATPLAMFTVNGMYETFNTNYLNLAKPWNEQGKFIDRFLALRLICNNLDNNLINLYNTEAPYRIQDR